MYLMVAISLPPARPWTALARGDWDGETTRELVLRCGSSARWAISKPQAEVLPVVLMGDTGA